MVLVRFVISAKEGITKFCGKELVYGVNVSVPLFYGRKPKHLEFTSIHELRAFLGGVRVSSEIAKFSSQFIVRNWQIGTMKVYRCPLCFKVGEAETTNLENCSFFSGHMSGKE